MQKKSYKRDCIPQKRPIVLSILLAVATPYIYVFCVCVSTCAIHVHRSTWVFICIFAIYMYFSTCMEYLCEAQNYSQIHKIHIYGYTKVLSQDTQKYLGIYDVYLCMYIYGYIYGNIYIYTGVLYTAIYIYTEVLLYLTYTYVFYVPASACEIHICTHIEVLTEVRTNTQNTYIYRSTHVYAKYMHTKYIYRSIKHTKYICNRSTHVYTKYIHTKYIYRSIEVLTYTQNTYVYTCLHLYMCTYMYMYICIYLHKHLHVHKHHTNKQMNRLTNVHTCKNTHILGHLCFS